MPDHTELEKLYREAQSALKAKNYESATNLLKQILVIDHNYKDASRLLARIVKEKRRRWYSDVRIWGTLGVLLLVGLGYFIAPKISSLYSTKPPTQVINATTTPSPTVIAIPTQTILPTPTPIPLTWKRIYGGDEFRRATITAIVVDPHDADVIYAGTDSAGIYKSIDGGMSWKPAHNGLLLANVDTLVIDPDNPRILYAGIISAGVYKTTDGGENWQIKKEEFNGSISKIVMDPTDSLHLYYTQGRGISQSKDGGEYWGNMNSTDFSSDIISFVMHPTDPKTLFKTERNGGVYISHDEGASWMLSSTIQKQTTNDHIGELKISGKTSYLIMLHQGIPGDDDTPSAFSSSDEGNTWNWRSKINCKTLAIHPDEKTILCGGRDGTIHASTDTAQTWNFLAALPIGQVRVITISPHDPNVLLAGGDGLFISFDGGRNWEERSNGLGREIIELGIDPMDNTKFYGVAGEKAPGNSEFIYRSLDQGLSWKFRTKLCQLVFGTEGNLVCNHLENTKPAESYLETDNLGGCGRGGFAAVNPYRQGEFYLAGGDNCAGIKISLNSGKSWNNTNISEDFHDPEFFFATDQKTIYAIPAWMWEHVWKSVDGTNWEACGETETTISSAKSRFAIDPNNSAVVYLATRGKGVYTSQDECKSWRIRNKGLDNQFINTIATDARDSNIVYAGTDSGAYISTDSGDTWSQINDGLLGATVIYSIAVDKDSNVYAATPYGIFKLESK